MTFPGTCFCSKLGRCAGRRPARWGNQQSERGMGFRQLPPLAQPLLVRGQFHQAQVAPDLALGQPVGGQMLAALRLDAVQCVAAPGHAPGHGLEHPGVHAFVAFGVVAHAGRGVQVDGLERAHEAQRSANRRGCRCPRPRRRHSRRPPAGTPRAAARLQPVDDEAVDLAPHHDGLLAGLGQQAAARARRRRRRSGRRHDFHGRHRYGGLIGCATRQRARQAGRP